MKTLLKIMAFVGAFALSFGTTTPPAMANVLPQVTVVQAPLNGMTLARSTAFETGNAAVESYVQVNSACTSRITLFSIGGSSLPHIPALSVYAPSCTGALTIQALINGTNRILHSTTNLSSGVPEYVTASYDGTTLSMTLNGTVIASQTFSGTLGPSASASSVGLGRSYDSFGDNFPGAIWSTNIYASGLTNGQIATDYAAASATPPYGTSLTVPVGVLGGTVTSPTYSSTSSVGNATTNLSGQILSDAPLFYLRLNETVGSTAYDSSGHNANGIYSTSVVTGPVMTAGSGPSLVSTEPDASVFSPDTSGTTATLGIGVPDANPSLRPITAISAEAVVQPDSFGGGTGQHVVVESGTVSSAPNGAWSIGISNGLPYASVSTNPIGLTTVTATTSIPVGKPVHIAFTYDETNLKLYVNGGLSNSVALTGSVEGYSTSGTWIGTDNNGGSHFGGYISNVAFYATALSAVRIEAHAASANGFSPPQSTDYNSTVALNTLAPTSTMLGWSSWTGPPGGVTMNQTLWNIVAKYSVFDDKFPSAYISSASTYGIQPGFLLDGNQKCSGDATAVCANTNLAAAYTEASFAHDCTGNRVYVPYSSTNSHNTLTDPRNSQLASDMNSVDIDANRTLGYSFVNADDFTLRSGITTHTGTYLTGSNTVPEPYCGYSDSSYLAGSRQTLTNLDLPAEVAGASSSQVASGIATSPNVFAAICDSCFSSSTNVKVPLQNGSSPFWLDQVDSELITGKLGKVFNIHSHGTSYVQTNDIQGYILASMLIGWSPNVTITMDGTVPNELSYSLTPSINIVPLNPVIPQYAIPSASTLRYGDVYMRAYRDCYLNGKNVGKCVAIVNPDPSLTANVPSDFQTGYTHSITVNNLNDASCLTDSQPCYKGIVTELGDTGSLVETTATPATTLPALGWEILAQ